MIASEPGSPGDLLRRVAAAKPDATALIDDRGATTWRELDAHVTAAAAGFVGAGLAPGDRLVLVHPTSTRFVIDYLGALRAGLIACPVNPALTAREFAHVVADSGAAAATTSLPDLPIAPPGLPVLPSGTSADADPSATPSTNTGNTADPRRDRRGDDTAVLLYTSGTTGAPRGAMLSARALLANQRQIAAVRPALLTGDDVLLLPLPLFHVFGLGAALGAILWHGATGVLTARFDPTASADLITRHRATVVVGAPPMFAAWAARLPSLADTFQGVRLALSGASSLPAALVRTYAAHGIALYEGYGLTETAPVLTTNLVGPDPDVRPEPRPGSIGRPLPDIDVALVDDHGDPVDHGDPGQLRVRGDNLFSGYWPDGTGNPGGPGLDGWFATGDIAVRDDEATGGGLRLVGRTTDLIVVNGFNVYPAEVEAVLGAIDGVAEVAVTAEPDERTGEAVVAYLVASPGVVLDPDQLLGDAARSLARYKIPARLHLVTDLPHTPTGKVQKWLLAPVEG